MIKTAPEAVIPATKRHIRKVAILGSGVMGSRIACHFANIGCQVLLLDIVPFDLDEEQKKDPKQRNRIVNESLKATFKQKPASLYSKKSASLIKTGNFDDNLSEIADCDWVLEAVIERLDIKKQVFENVEKYRKLGTLITSNTSGIPIHQMLEGRSDDFKKHFCGSHFFNPPRYLKLLEIIPTPETDSEVTDFLMNYGDVYLGKTTVLCKDTPAFIANRIGVFSIQAIFQLMEEMDMTIEEVDMLTGPVAGRPKSATFRTCDVVGLDTLVKVAKGAYDSLPNDDQREMFKIPSYVEQMLEKGWLGSKTGQGFYKREKAADGKKTTMALNVKTMEYAPKAKPRFDCVGAARKHDDLKKRIEILHSTGDKGSEFLNKLSSHLFRYVSNRVPEISDEIYKIDDALCAGFGWELGPFEYWDVLGVERMIAEMDSAGFTPAQWVMDMIADGKTSFYTVEGNTRKVYDPATKTYVTIPGTEDLIVLDNYRGNEPVWKNSGSILHDIGDGVLCLEFTSKMNSIGADVLEGINKAIEIAENDGWKGLVIGNDAANFSVGANLGMIGMLAGAQEFDQLHIAVKTFQDTMMRCRYSSIPVVAGPHGMTLGGGCELSMHCDRAVAAAETYIGLVEVGVGLLPAGGGTKEMTLRFSDDLVAGDAELPIMTKYLMNIGQAKVATSAAEAFELGIFQRGNDRVVTNSDRVIAEAKKEVLSMADQGYTMPVQRTDIKAMGRSGLGSIMTSLDGMKKSNYISEHDQKIADKIAYVMCGGDLSSPTNVSEQYLLDLEREAFVALCAEQKTLERISTMVTTGRPLRN